MVNQKFTRNERMLLISQILFDQPGRVIPLTEFVDELKAAKSTISEDLTIVKENLGKMGEGTLRTIPGKLGGVQYIPSLSRGKTAQVLNNLKERLTMPHRIIPGGYLYMSDIFSDPCIIKEVAKIFAGYFADRQPDVVLTVETKGILLAGFTAGFLSVPLAIARRNSRVTEGPVITINYVTGSGSKIQTMSLSTRAVPKGSRILLIDDFMKRGGTLKGLKALTKEFDSEVAGMGVLLNQAQPGEKLVSDYLSLGTLERIDEQEGEITLTMVDPTTLIPLNHRRC